MGARADIGGRNVKKGPSKSAESTSTPTGDKLDEEALKALIRAAVALNTSKASG
jgi:hypothetical protein